MFIRIASTRVVPIIITLAIGLLLGGCAAQSEDESTPAAADEATTQTLPIAGGAFVTPLILSGPISFVGATGAVGGTAIGGGGGAIVNGGGINSTGGTIGTNIGTGPIGFSTGGGFSTGPITNSYNSGPIGFSSGGGTSISSNGTGMPVITTNCTGFGCP